MTTDPATTVERLRERIRYHDRKYHIESAPEISDLEYDRLFEKLTKVEEAHPELVTPESPTQRVAGEPVEVAPNRTDVQDSVGFYFPRRSALVTNALASPSIFNLYSLRGDKNHQ